MARKPDDKSLSERVATLEERTVWILRIGGLIVALILGQYAGIGDAASQAFPFK